MDFLSPLMQEFLFVATANRNGECDCTPKFGKPGFVYACGCAALTDLELEA